MRVKVGIDNSYLTLLLNPQASGSVPDAATKVQTLIADLTERNCTILIPTPVLTECLVKSGGSIQDAFEKLKAYACFQIRPFDDRAAIELAVLLRGETKMSAKEARKVATASKIQFDKQIVSVVKVHGATVIYSDDGDLCSFAEQCGLKAVRLADLPLRPTQSELPLTGDVSQVAMKTVAVAASAEAPDSEHGAAESGPKTEAAGEATNHVKGA